MNCQEAAEFIPRLMRIEFEGALWSWLVDPTGGGSAPWMAEVGPMAEAFAPTDVFPDTGIRVIVHCNDPSGDGLWPQIHFKCGVLKDIPDHPELPAIINKLNCACIFGRLQLHTGSNGERAVSAEHFVAVRSFTTEDVACTQALLDTLGMVRNQCAGKAGHQLRPIFGGRPWSDGNDGALLAMAG